MQYVLDNYATTAEAVEALRKEEFRIVPLRRPRVSRHGALSISDASGDSAIFEYLDGKLVIHHGKEYQVMTNAPPFDQQLALNKYWESLAARSCYRHEPCLRPLRPTLLLHQRSKAIR